MVARVGEEEQHRWKFGGGAGTGLGGAGPSGSICRRFGLSARIEGGGVRFDFCGARMPRTAVM
jgi:hypothetical protein